MLSPLLSCRDMEPVRLLGLQFIGRLLVDLPIEKKGPKFFNIAIGRSKSVSEGHKKMSSDMQPIFPIISDMLFSFPQTEILCATLFDVLLGGASPKQVLYHYVFYFHRFSLNMLMRTCCRILR